MILRRGLVAQSGRLKLKRLTITAQTTRQQHALASCIVYQQRRRRVPLTVTLAAVAAFAAIPAAHCWEEPSDGAIPDRMERWREKWQKGQLSWHRTEPYPALVKHYPRWLSTMKHPTAAVLVPLCGKSVDLPWLARKGHEVVGVEGVETAVWELQRDCWLNFQQAQVAPSAVSKASSFTAAPAFAGSRPGYVFKTDAQGLGYYKDSAGLKVFADRKLPLKVLVGDFFDVGPAELGQLGGCFDRGSLVAIPPHARQQYVRKINELLEVGGTVLLVTLEYDQRKLGGPAYSLSKADVTSLYRPLGFSVEQLGQEDVKAEHSGGKWDAVPTVHENVFLITKLRDVSSGSSSKRWFKPWTWFSAL